MKILGIETSCDETAAAVVEGQNPPTPPFTKGAVKVLSSVVSSQIEIHKKYGGVVPEVAAREHVLNILPVINEALEKAGLTPRPPLLIRRGELKGRGVDAIAVTTGPGLITSLQVGVETAKVLSYVWNIPAISVNHIEGHIYANFVSENPKSEIRNPKLIFPALILTVSGGHTMLILMKGHGEYKVIGETLDDAAGEAFDKAAAMMSIGYPGGPVISKWAEKFKKSPQPHLSRGHKIPPTPFIKGGERGIKNIILPRPMINSKDYNFSFSGLKTALLYKIQKDPTSSRNTAGLRGASPDWKKRIPEYCFEFQQAVIDVLVAKTVRAAEELKVYPVKSGSPSEIPKGSEANFTGQAGAPQQAGQFNRVKTIMLSGGVAANLELRDQMAKQIKKLLPASCFLLPDLQYTTDNAAMIAAAGYFKTLRKKFMPPLRKQSEASWRKLKADCNLEF